MRTHADIVRQFGASALRRELEVKGLRLSATTVQRWADRDSIPAAYWPTLDVLGAATLEELSSAAAPAMSPGVAEDAAPFNRPESGKTGWKHLPPNVFISTASDEERAAARAYILSAPTWGWSSEGRTMTRDEMNER